MVHAIVHPICPYCGFEDGGDELISLTPIDLEDCHGEIVLERYIMMIYITAKCSRYVCSTANIGGAATSFFLETILLLSQCIHYGTFR